MPNVLGTKTRTYINQTHCTRENEENEKAKQKKRRKKKNLATLQSVISFLFPSIVVSILLPSPLPQGVRTKREKEKDKEKGPQKIHEKSTRREVAALKRQEAIRCERNLEKEEKK